MLRLIVVALFAANLLLVGMHVASSPPSPDRPVLSPPPDFSQVPPLQLMDDLAPSTSVQPLRQCFSAGPFETPASLAGVRTGLEDVAVLLGERESEALVELGYWVTLPPFADFAGAGMAMRAINAAGLQDVAVVSDSAGEFRVSLGYFLDERNARRRRDEARALGFEADTRLQRETQPRFWLDYAFEQPESAAWAEDHLELGAHRAIPCPLTPGP